MKTVATLEIEAATVAESALLVLIIAAAAETTGMMQVQGMRIKDA